MSNICECLPEHNVNLSQPPLRLQWSPFRTSAPLPLLVWRQCLLTSTKLSHENRTSENVLSTHTSHSMFSSTTREALMNSVVYGLTYGFSQGALFFGYVIAFRFGAFLVTRPADHILHTDFNDVFVVLLALVFGAMAAGQAGAFAPNYAKARLSANRIFALLNRIPATSAYCSEEGIKPVCCQKCTSSVTYLFYMHTHTHTHTHIHTCTHTYTHTLTQDKVNGAITVENVCFRYPSRPEMQILNGLSVSLNPGQTLALVGPSGCGKSTVVSLLERFYEPKSGCLKVDQQDIRDLNIRWLRQNIGLVSQEPVLFNASIADNIRYGANFREVSDEEVIAAATAANIHSFIETLPEVCNTIFILPSTIRH